MILAICLRNKRGKLSSNPTLIGFPDYPETFAYCLKQCTFSAAHFGADYPAYIKNSDGRLIVRMATYRGV